MSHELFTLLSRKLKKTNKKTVKIKNAEFDFMTTLNNLFLYSCHFNIILPQPIMQTIQMASV